MLLLIFKNIQLIVGWAGTFFYLLAYFLLSINKLKSNQRVYHLLNIVGAAGLTVNALYYADLPNMVANIFWGLIAIVAIVTITKQKRN